MVYPAGPSHLTEATVVVVALGGQHRRLRAVCLRRAGGAGRLRRRRRSGGSLNRFGTASRGHRGGRLLARGRLICAR